MADDAPMFDWNDLRYVLALHRGGSLAAAAQALGINATTVARRLGVLEEQVGARLFDRVRGGVRLTAAGADLLPHAERMEREVLAVARRVAGADRRAVGRVRLSTTETLATRFLAPHLGRFHDRHPQLTLELHCTMRAVSLGHREADVVVRLAQPREPDVVVRKLAKIELGLYAARGYLARHGKPAAPDASLAGHRAVLFADTPAFAVENAWLEPRVVGAAVVLRSDSVSSIFSAIAAGAGLGLLPRRVADREPDLVLLPTATVPEARTVWQGVHRDLARSARIRAVLDFVGEVVSAEA